MRALGNTGGDGAGGAARARASGSWFSGSGRRRGQLREPHYAVLLDGGAAVYVVADAARRLEGERCRAIQHPDLGAYFDAFAPGVGYVPNERVQRTYPHDAQARRGPERFDLLREHPHLGALDLARRARRAVPRALRDELHARLVQLQQRRAGRAERKNRAGELLLDERLQGQLYVKGVWIADLRADGLGSGLNFRQLRLDRDRRTTHARVLRGGGCASERHRLQDPRRVAWPFSAPTCRPPPSSAIIIARSACASG